MSALGSYPECNNGVCICPTCQNRIVSCAPCMDCIGEDDATHTQESVENGYITQCCEYLERRIKNEKRE